MIKEILGDSQLPEIKPNQQHYQNGTIEPQLTEEGDFSYIEMSTWVSQMILSPGWPVTGGVTNGKMDSYSIQTYLE